MNDEQGELVKVLVDLPNHWLWKGESMWARNLGNDLYELDNSPFCAYGLNNKDVLFAQAQSTSEKPRILRVERSGGHRTLRFFFKTEVDRSDRNRMLGQLNELGVTYEGHEYRFFSIDIPPTADYDAVCMQLSAWETDGLLEYETCEERVPGSFDDAPQD